MRSQRRRERGAAAVEFALSMTLLLPLLLGGMHLGVVLAARHRLGDAVGVATRQAAIAQTVNTAAIRANISSRLGGEMTECGTLLISAGTVGSPPNRRVEVSATCVLRPAFGAAFLEGVGPSQFTVSAAFPY